jgi:hypothetical protein
MIGFMAHSKQAWEQFVETDKIISDAFLALAEKGFIEWDIVNWLAEWRRAEATPLDSGDAEAALLSAKILEQACKEMESAGEKASNAGIRASDTFSPQRLSDEEYQRELKEHLVPLLDEGIDEIEILSCLALWRKEFSLDKNRGEVSQVDAQFARILYAASEKLESAFEEWAESDPFDIESGTRASSVEQSALEIIEFTPAAKILTKNPKLAERCSDIAQLIKQFNRTGRNEPCPCESGKKFKKCCGGI